jgi:hypothetical protein
LGKLPVQDKRKNIPEEIQVRCLYRLIQDLEPICSLFSGLNNLIVLASALRQTA